MNNNKEHKIEKDESQKEKNINLNVMKVKRHGNFAEDGEEKIMEGN